MHHTFPEAPPAQYAPIGQTSVFAADVEPVGQYEPGAAEQGEHVEAPADEYEPAGQSPEQLGVERPVAFP